MCNLFKAEKHTHPLLIREQMLEPYRKSLLKLQTHLPFNSPTSRDIPTCVWQIKKANIQSYSLQHSL